MKSAFRFILVLGLLAVSSVTRAHDLVLVAVGQGEFLIRFGHPGEYEAADLARLVKLDAYAPHQSAPNSLVELKPVRQGVDWLEQKLSPAGGRETMAMVVGEYDNGYWASIEPGKYFNTSRAMLPQAKDAGYYRKFAKGLFPTVGEQFNRASGQQLEIIPQNDPFQVKPGEKLAVQVIFRSKPLVNVGVEIGDGQTKMKEEEIPRYQTNRDGVAELPIRRAGLQLIAIDYQVAPLHPDLCDHDDYSASLAFTTAD